MFDDDRVFQLNTSRRITHHTNKFADIHGEHTMFGNILCQNGPKEFWRKILPKSSDFSKVLDLHIMWLLYLAVKWVLISVIMFQNRWRLGFQKWMQGGEGGSGRTGARGDMLVHCFWNLPGHMPACLLPNPSPSQTHIPHPYLLPFPLGLHLPLPITSSPTVPFFHPILSSLNPSFLPSSLSLPLPGEHPLVQLGN